jgi:hypothetical protein
MAASRGTSRDVQLPIIYVTFQRFGRDSRKIVLYAVESLARSTGSNCSYDKNLLEEGLNRNRRHGPTTSKWNDK